MAAGKKQYNKKRTGAKRSYKKPSAPRDGQTVLISSYFEITNKQAAAGADTKLSYSIKCDPRNCDLLLDGPAVAIGGEGISVKKGDNSALVVATATGAKLPFTRFAQFAPLYNQYKINSIKLDVMVDRECGLENPLMFATDKAVAAPATNVGTLVASAHKQFTMTESRRSGKYGWKPTQTADKDYRNMSQVLHSDNCHFIKVYQDIGAKNDGVCSHKVLVTISATLKDSTGTAVALN